MGGLFTWRTSLALGVLLFVVYNANGREIGSYDTQPSKFLAREIVLRQTLTLDATVRELPALAERHGFQRDRAGHFRSAYSVVPALFAAVVGFLLAPFRVFGSWPLGPALVAKVTASLLTALAVLLCAHSAARAAGRPAGIAVALGLGLGTNYWAVVSQTLWQHESAAFGLALAVWAFARPVAEFRAPHVWLASAGLAIAGAARPQLAPAVAAVALGLLARRRSAADVAALSPLVVGAAAVVTLNTWWFGHPLGATLLLEAQHERVHGVSTTWSWDPIAGAAGLLIGPSRGLLVFSPIVAVSLVGLASRGARRRDGAGWLATAAVVQGLFYANYSVWWGGFTYGPRYALDLLPLLVPLAAAGVARIRGSRAATVVALAALAWSVAAAGTGAFCYPAERWNTDPESVDLAHERLWDWRDPQILRCWRVGPSPQNFVFFED